MIKKILTTFFVMLMFALGHSQNISLIGNKTITVAGASQPADLNWTIPAGKNRIVIVQYWIERDHRNGSGANATTTSNNFPSADLGRTAFSPTINGTAMVPKITGSYAAYFAPSTSSGGTEANNTYLSDNYHMYFLGEADLPTSSSATFKFGIPNAPKNAADNLIISISVYSNVSNLSIVNSLPNPSGIDFIRDSSGSNPTTTNGSGNKSTAVTAATTVVPGRTASEVLYHGIIASSMEKNVALATGSTWTAFNQTPLSNSAGYPFNTDIANPPQVVSNENDGIYLTNTFYTGNATPPNLVYNKNYAGMVNYIKTHIVSLLPLAKPSYSGTVVRDTDGPTTINGTGTGAAAGFVNVVDPNGVIIYSAPVNATNGTFNVPLGYMVEGTAYKLVLTTSKTSTTPTLNTGWFTVGEATEPTGNDGAPDGILNITAGSANVTGLLFGVNTGIDVGVTKTDNITKYKRSSTLTYTIVATNYSAVAVSNVAISDPLPANFGSADMKITSVVPTAGTTTTGLNVGASGAINGTINFAVGGKVTITVTLNVNAFYPGIDANPNINIDKNINNTVTLTMPSGVTDINPSNNSATDTDTPAIDARNDGYNDPKFTNLQGGQVGIVTVNDEVNGQLITNPASQVNISLIDNGGLAGATINANGMLTIPNGTPAGVYLLQYTICDKADLTDCDTATILKLEYSLFSVKFLMTYFILNALIS